MTGVAGHQLYHKVTVSLLLIGKQLPVLLVGDELVVYIAVVRKVLRHLGSIYFAGYGLAGIKHEEAIRAPYAFQHSLWRRACILRGFRGFRSLLRSFRSLSS